MLVLRKVRYLLLALCLPIISCTASYQTPPHGTPIDQSIDTINRGIVIDRQISNRHVVPMSVHNALVPSMAASPLIERRQPKRFDILANKVPARSFFVSLVDGTPYNMVISPNIGGTISLELKNVTLEQTLQAIRDSYNIEYRKTTYGYEVFPQKLETKIFTLNYLDVKRKGKSLVEVTSGQISEQLSGISSGGAISGPSPISANQTTTSGSTVETRSEANFWRDLQISLRQFVPNEKGRSVVVNSQSGVITVHAFPKELKMVARYLDRIQCNMDRQVILEAKVLEVQLDSQFQAGIDWNLIGRVAQNEGGVGQTSLLPFGNTSLNDFDSIFTLRVKGDFGGLIKLLQTQGNVQVLSSPRISTVNNQKAVIKVGQDQFFVTGVTSTSVVTGSSNTVFPSENINLTPFFSGITLDVTPQISSHGEVILHIHPTVSVVKDQEKTIILGNNGNGSQDNTFVLPLAQSTIRESDNIVRAHNGQVIVIGGLMQNSAQEQIAGIPLISKLPVIGPFFRRTEQISQKIELVILLRPILVDNNKEILQMEDMGTMMSNMRRGFHEGGLPEVFGNDGDIAPPPETYSLRPIYKD